MQYRVEIWAKTVEISNTIPIDLGGNGFNIVWQKATDPILGGLMPSTCTVNFLVKNSTELTAAHTVLTANNHSYYIKIKRSSLASPAWDGINVWWGGWITSGFDGYPDKAFPYIVEIKATCSLNKPLNKYNNQVDVASQSDYQELTKPLQLFETNYDITTILGNTHFKWAFQSNWWNSQSGSTPPADTNPLRETYYNRAAFVTRPEDFPLTIENYIDELKGVLKPFMLRLMQSAGRYWVQQSLFVDEAEPDPSISINASSGEIFPGGGGFPANLADEVTIDNTATPTTANKGIILAGAKYNVTNEAKSVRAKYIYGNNFCTIPTSLDYTSGFQSLGYLSQGTTNLQFYLNVVLKQTLITAGGAITPCTGQSDSMTGFLTIKIKVGNKYLAHEDGALSPYQFIWTTTDSSISIFTGAGTYYENGPGGITTSQTAVTNALTGFGGNYPYFFTQFQPDFPNTGVATATARFYLAGVTLPDLGSTFGEVQFQIIENNSYILYWTDDIPFTNIWGNWTEWLNEHNPAASTGLNYNTATSTPVTPALQTIDLGLVPYGSDITVDEESVYGDEQAPIGAIYYAAQSGNEQAPDINLGNLTLGTNSSSNQITTLRAKSGSEYIETGGFRSGATGSFIEPGQLLCNEYFRTIDEPLITLQGTIVSTSYEAHRTINYNDTIGGTNARYIFNNGRFNPQADAWTGVWTKLNILETDPPFSTDDIFTDPGPTPPPNPTTPPDTSPTAGGPKVTSPGNLETTNTKQRYLLNDLLIGTTTETVVKGVQINKVDVKNLICKVYDDQKLFLVDKGLRAATELTANGAQNASATQVNFNNISPIYNYPAGSYVMLRTNDLSNVITGGGGSTTPNLYKGITTTQIFIKPDEFKTPNATSFTLYSRDFLGAVTQTSYTRNNKALASFFMPLDYKIMSVLVYSNQNRAIRVLKGQVQNDTTSLLYSGNANTAIPFSTPYTGQLGYYVIIEFDFRAAGDEIRGALITIQAV